MNRLSAWLALGVAGPLFVAQAYRNWGNWDYWATWGVDLLVATLLAWAGFGALRGAAPKFLASAWSFATALYLSSFISHAYRAANTGQAGESKLAMIIGALFLVSLVGAGMTLLGRRSPPV